MSKKVDERVVEMRFDNQQFESATKQTMSTLDKLKAALKFPSSSKSLESISSAAKKVDFSGMNKGIETVNAKFSAMQVIGMTALSNITSAAMRAGSNLVKSFTLDPVVSGFKEYELQMNSIQTILANTKSKGTTMSDVTAALDELNEYADLTIYNFAEMTKNIGTFTAAGVDLDTSVGAIKGIANLGAMSSSTSAQVSTAMYQLSQALATGRVSLMDWNSVVNAGMGGEQFQNALKRTAENFGYDVDSMIKKYGSFRESLTQGGWLTADVLNETLNQIGGAYDEAALKAKGYSNDQIAAILDLAETATNAATEVKTFSQLMDTLKEAAGSGWAKTWQLIFGDFEQAKEFFSGLHETLEPIVTGPIDAMNSVIEGAMGGGGSRWGEFTDQLDKAGTSVDVFQKKLSEVASAKGVDLSALIKEYGSLEDAMASGKITSDMVSDALSKLAVSTDKVSDSTKTLAEWQQVVDDVWLGKYANIDTGRMEKLAAAGWEYAEVQKLVNMTVDGHRLTLEDLSAAQIESMGYTKEQAEALANLAAEAKKSGGDINTLINDILAPKRSGRELFLEGLENMLTAILRPLQAVGKAFSDVFGMDSAGLYDLIEGFNKFSKAIIISETDAKNLSKTFKGLFSVIKLVATVFGNTFTFAIKAANAILAPFGTNLLGVTGFIGELIYQFEQWATSGNAINDMLNAIGSALSWIIDPLIGFVSGFSDIPVVAKAIDKLKTAFRGIIDYFKSFEGLNPGEVFQKLLSDVQSAFDKLRNLTWTDVLNGLSDFGSRVRDFFSNLVDDMAELGPDIIEGLQNGLSEGVEGIVKFLQDLGSRIIEAICAVLGIHSPSTVFFEIGMNIVQGLVNGIKYLSGEVSGVIHDLVEDIKYALSGIDWGVVLPVAGAVGSFMILYQMADALQGFAAAAKQFSSPFQSIANLGNSLNTTVKGFNSLMGFTDSTSSIKFKQIAEGVKILAEAIAILAGSVSVLTLIDTGKMWIAIGAIGALAGIIGGLAWALNRFAAGGTVLQALQLNTTLLSIGGALALLAVSAKIISTIDESGIANAQSMITLFGAVVIALIAVAAIGGPRIGEATQFLSKIGVAFLLLGVAARLLGGMDRSSMNSAEEMITTFAAVVLALMAMSTIGGARIGTAIMFLTNIGKAFLLLGVAARLLGGMDRSSMDSAREMLISFAGVVGVLILFAAIGGAKAGAATQFLSQVGIAFLALGVAARLLGGLSKDQIENAKEALYSFVGVISILMIVGSLAKGVSKGVTSGLLGMSLAIGILAGVAVLLSYVDVDNLETGVTVVTIFGLLVSLMAQSCRGVRNITGTMMGIAVAIGVMAASVAVLSFLDEDRVYGATACMTILIGMLALVAKASGSATASTKTMLTIVAALGIVAAALVILANMNPENVLSSAVGLSAVMLALAGSLKIIAGIKDISLDAIGGMAALTLVVGALSVIISNMGAMNPASAVGNAVALGTLAVALSTALLLIGEAKDASWKAYATLAVLTRCMAVLGEVLKSMNGIDPVGSVANAVALGVLINALAVATAILGATAPVAQAATKALGPLVAVFAALTLIVAAAGALASAGAGAIVDQAAGILTSIGEALGGFVGGIVAGFSEAVISVIPKIGQALSDFGTNVQPFLDTMSGIDPSVGEGISTLAGALVALTGAGFLDSLTKMLSGGIFGKSGLEQMATQMPLLGEAFAGFAENLDGVDLESASTGAQAVKTIAEALSQVPTEGGFLGAILGGKNYDKFGEGMGALGEGLSAFDEATQDMDDLDTISTRVDAISTIMNAMSNVPATGGWLQDLFGEQNWKGFSEGMEAMGDGLVAFVKATSVEGFSLDAIGPRVNALTTLMNAMANVPNSGGLLQDLLGEQNWQGFQAGMMYIGYGLYNFEVATRGIGDAERLNTLCGPLSNLITAMAGVPASGGWIDGLLGKGEANYSGLKTGLGSLGEGVAAFYSSTEGIESPERLPAIAQVAVDLLNTLNSLNASNGSAMADMFNGIDRFGGNMSTMIGNLGASVAAFSGATADSSFENVGPAIEAARKILTFLKEMESLDTSNVENFKEAVDSLANTNIDGMVEAFSSAQGSFDGIGEGIISAISKSFTSDSLADAGRTVIDGLVAVFDNAAGEFESAGEAICSSISSKISADSSIASAISSTINSAKTTADSLASGFSTVGSNIGAGIVTGMEDWIGPICDKAAALVNAAKRAANEAADSNSPSKVFRYEVAGYMGWGMVVGLEDYESKVGRAGGNLARSAIDGVKSTISRISDVFNSDLDVNPTIRPVLDLSDVRNGANSINSMFNASVPTNIMGDISSINRSMNDRIQNGTFKDVVDAVDRLRSGLADIGGPSYTINGITYDDGSNIAAAIGGLTRAIRLEGRV